MFRTVVDSRTPGPHVNLFNGMTGIRYPLATACPQNRRAARDPYETAA